MPPINLDDILRVHEADRRFVESLPGHVPGDPASQRRVPIILERLHRVATVGA